MLLVSMYISSIDSAVRSLDTLGKLSTASISSYELDMSLSDMVGF